MNDTPNEADGGSKTASIAWKGVDVVLVNDDQLKAFGYSPTREQQRQLPLNGASSGGCDSSNDDDDEEAHRQTKEQPNADNSNVPSSIRRVGSVKRLSSPDLAHYGWLRHLHLTTTTPSLDSIMNWNFDVLQYEENTLIHVFIKMLEYYNLVELFDLDRMVLERYVEEVLKRHRKDCYYQREFFGPKHEGETTSGEEKHSSESDDVQQNTFCEYHNWYHAVSCAHVSFLLISLGGASAYLQPIEIFSVLLAALIHDLDHPGTNNDFEVKRNSELAERYENDAVLERHSINLGLSLCQKNEELDWLKCFKEGSEDRTTLEEFITECILATDPAKHADIVREALGFVEGGPQQYDESCSSVDEDKTTQMAYFNKHNPQHRLFIGRIILHSADISNPLHSSFEVARDWAIRVTSEFSKQATKEKELDLPVTSFMDGLNSEYKIAKMQIGFFGFMVQPLFKTLGVLLPGAAHLEGWGVRNCDEYHKIVDAYERENNMS